MEVAIKIEGVQDALRKLNSVDNEAKAGIRRALFKIGGMVKKTAVEYAPISPTTSMLRQFDRRLRKGGADADRMYVAGRRGQSGRVVKLTAFYMHKMPMLLAKSPRNTNRPLPGGLQGSIGFRTNENNLVEVFVPANSPAGTYAAKIHDERGSSWKDLGPGSQAKGPQAREKFILRAFTDNTQQILMIVNAEMAKAIERGN